MNSNNDVTLANNLRNLDVYGYTHIPNYYSKDIITRARNLVEQNYVEINDVEAVGLPDRDKTDKMVFNLQNIDKFFTDLLVDPLIKSMLMAKLNDPYYRFLPPDVPNYILNYYNARSSGTALDLHIDSHVPSPGDHTWTTQIIIVLDDMDETNGCSVVVPGSHRSGRYTDRDLKNLKPLIAKSGDLLLWDSRLWHGTGENKTGGSRWALVATMTQWWLKQNMDVTRSLPDKIYQQLSDEQKALLGFCSIPPTDDKTRINTKCGYDFLKSSVNDYY